MEPKKVYRDRILYESTIDYEYNAKKKLENIEPPISNTLAKTPSKNRFLEIFSVLASPIFMIFFKL